MKKGIVSQVFIYIFVIIVIAIVLLFGFKQVVNLKNLTEKSVYVAFKNDFSKAVDSVYYLNKGSTLVFSESSRNKGLGLPNKIKKICFQNNKVKFDSELYKDFIVDNLEGELCIDVAKGKLNFKLENNVENEEVKVKISGVGT